jgi:hypothetical protein
MRETFVNKTDVYYKNIKDVYENIDNELTVSHILRFPNSFTRKGLPYGTLLAEKLGISNGNRILEVGPGLGDIAGNICEKLTDFIYTFCDLSFAYIQHLKKRFRGQNFSFEHGDFLTIPLKEKFDVIICNEVLGDLPTIVNMNLSNPFIRSDDEDVYYDAFALIKTYGIKTPKVFHFNYGAFKFVEKAKSLLEDDGKIFICEHASKPVKKIGVFGHYEFTIDFDLLEIFAKKIGFKTERGILTDLLGVDKRKRAVLFYTQPELKMIYALLKRNSIPVLQKAYEIDEIIEVLEKSGLKICNKTEYKRSLLRDAKPLSKITNQFNYLILQNKK